MAILANNKLRLIVTGKCNINCFYCHNEGQAKEDSFIALPNVVALTAALDDAGVCVGEVTLSGGEPMLHPRLEEIVSIVATVTDRVTLVSNGLLAKPAQLQSLAAWLDLRLSADSG